MPESPSLRDERHMRRALRLAVLGREAAPNPMVGCVILDKTGEKVGEGYHVRPGEPHAEAAALRLAGDRARGGAAYVTLEPCAHHGRTPPCAEALVTAGLARVVIATTDPDSRVSGQGIERLRQAGITVELGLCEQESRRLNRAYILHRTTGGPMVTVKTAMTLDGKVATTTGDSRWITTPTTRLWVHRRLRTRNPAILVGVGTVLADDPSLTIRLPHRPHARNPLRVIVDSHLRTPLESRVVRQGRNDGLTLIAYVDDPNRRQAALSDAGADLVKVGPNLAGRVDLAGLMSHLGNERNIIGVLVEGGPEIVAGLFAEGLVDRYICTLAPKVIGGSAAPGPIGGRGLAERMQDAVRTTGFTARRSGEDLVLSSDFAGMV